MTPTQELRICAMVRRKTKDKAVGNEKCGACDSPFLPRQNGFSSAGNAMHGHVWQHVQELLRISTVAE